jgi:hypothetical protein
MAPFFPRAEPHFVDTMHDARLLIARQIHDVQRENLAWYPREGDVEVDLHLFAYGKS